MVKGLPFLLLQVPESRPPLSLPDGERRPTTRPQPHNWPALSSVSSVSAAVGAGKGREGRGGRGGKGGEGRGGEGKIGHKVGPSALCYFMYMYPKQNVLY